MVTIHDPVHGSLEVTPSELRLIDSRPLQRLRFIKQLGFTELAFPGGSHNRLVHSLGAMHMATRMVERLLGPVALAAPDYERLRQSVRLAALCHDVGHAPMSHVSERVMPPLSALGLWTRDGEPDRQATHEDFTASLLNHSELGDLIERHFGGQGITGKRVAALCSGVAPAGDGQAYVVRTADGTQLDLLGLLSQIVSGELDCDRMDYLRRDAYFCGVSYGNFDSLWLVNHLTTVPHEGGLAMALLHKGVWAFENYLLARYHMFLSVYYHHTAICFDHMLGQFYQSGEYTLPAEPDAYLDTDDVHLLSALRASKNPWAQAIVRRKPYRLLVECHDSGDADTSEPILAELERAGIACFGVRKRAVLSKYVKKRDRRLPLWVVEPELERQSRIEDYTPLFRRFDTDVGVSRVFCRSEDLDRARALIKR